MAMMKYDQTPAVDLGGGAERRVGRTDKLMIAVIDFRGRPGDEPPVPHAHPHEQVCYVAAGEVIADIGGEQAHLKAGDVYLVPPNVPHTVRRLTEHVRLVDCFTPIREDFLK
jgi:quercetin dioxygenase-like cupin family protein